MDSHLYATAFSALSHVSRVNVFRCLLRHHPDGLTAQELAAQTGIPPSTLSHHLREMEQGGVILRTPHGRQTITTLNLSRLMQLIGDLMSVCCAADPSLRLGGDR